MQAGLSGYGREEKRYVYLHEYCPDCGGRMVRGIWEGWTFPDENGGQLKCTAILDRCERCRRVHRELTSLWQWESGAFQALFDAWERGELSNVDFAARIREIVQRLGGRWELAS